MQENPALDVIEVSRWQKAPKQAQLDAHRAVSGVRGKEGDPSPTPLPGCSSWEGHKPRSWNETMGNADLHNRAWPRPNLVLLEVSPPCLWSGRLPLVPPILL